MGENSHSTNNNNSTTPSGRTWIEPDYDQSRAIGNYFFICSKKKEDITKCRFARPVEDHEDITPKSERICTFFIKKGGCSKGSSCKFLHEKTPTTTTTGGGDDEEKKRKRTTEDADNNVEKKKKENDDDDDANESDSDGSSSDDDDDDDEQDICKVATTTSKNDDDDKDINEQITASIMSKNKGTTATSDSSSSD